LSKRQEAQGGAIIELHRHLGRHVKNMQTWKDFLEQDKEYDSIDLHIIMAEDLAPQPFEQRIEAIDGAFNGIIIIIIIIISVRLVSFTILSYTLTTILL
jgi:hypothetical protein